MKKARLILLIVGGALCAGCLSEAHSGTKELCWKET